jgi:hypothetical protein
LQLRGLIHYARGRIQEAVHDLKAALELDPNNADTLLFLSYCCVISGKTAAARPLIDRLQVVDPLTPLTRWLPGTADVFDGNLQAAIGPCRQMYEMDPGNPLGRLFYVWVLALVRRTDAIPAVVEGFPPEVRDTVPARLAFFLAHAVAGNRRAAHAALTPEIEPAARVREMFARALADGHASLGEPERCDRVARGGRRPRVHQPSVPRAARSDPRVSPEPSPLPAPPGHRARAVGAVRGVGASGPSRPGAPLAASVRGVPVGEFKGQAGR